MLGARPASLFVSAFAPDDGYPFPHVHRSIEELFLVLEGEIEFRLGDRHIVAAAGAGVWIPAGTAHAFHNPGHADARVAITVSPPAALSMILEVGRAAPDRERMDEVLRRYDSYLLRT